MGFHYREHDEEERDGRSVVEEAFAFEDEVEPTGDSEFLENREYGRGVGGRYERSEQKRHLERNVDAEREEQIPKGERYREGRNHERNDRKQRYGPQIPQKLLVLYVVRRFEQEDRQEYVEEDVRRKFEVVQEFGESEFGRHRYGHAGRDERYRGRNFHLFRPMGNSCRDDEEADERKG